MLCAIRIRYLQRIFAEDHIQHPMELIFYPPMLSNSPRGLFGIER